MASCLIIVDASFCPATKAAAYAFWIVREKKKTFVCKVHEKPCKVVVDSELYAIVEAIFYGIRRCCIKQGDTLKIRSDCEQAILYLCRDRKSDNEDFRQSVINSFNREVFSNKLCLQFQHIRGHSGRDTDEKYMHSICDSRARKKMRIARQLLTSDGTAQTVTLQSGTGESHEQC